MWFPYGCCFCLLVWIGLLSSGVTSHSSRVQPPSHRFEPLDFDRTPLDQLRSHLNRSPVRSKRELFTLDNSDEPIEQFQQRWTIDALPSEDSDDHFRRTAKRKRSLPPPTHFELNFRALDRRFRLRLHAPRSNQVFAPDPHFESTGRGKFHYSTNHVIQGHLAGKMRFLQKKTQVKVKC